MESRTWAGPVALVYEGSRTPRESIAAQLASMHWRAWPLTRNLHAVTLEEADLWVVDVASEGFDAWSTIGMLTYLDATVPLLVVTDERRLERQHKQLVDLYGRWPSDLQLLVRPYSRMHLQTLVSCLTGVQRAARAGEPAQTLGGGLLSVDTRKHLISYGGRPVHLPQSEYRVLVALAQAGGQLVTKSQLLYILHGPDNEHDETTIKRHIHGLRHHLEAAGADPECIRTVRGDGYTLEVDRLGHPLRSGDETVT